MQLGGKGLGLAFLICFFSSFQVIQVQGNPLSLVNQPLLDNPFVKDFVNAGKRFLNKIFPSAEMVVKEPTICDDTVQQYSGYIPLNGKNMFFWLMESRNNPKEDPLVIWVQGGPGCSSIFGLLTEIGPCFVGKDGIPVRNEFSWNRNATILVVEQPMGTGFSDGLPMTFTTQRAASDYYDFLQKFFTTFPQYRDLPFHIFGESYAGHYIPEFGYHFNEMNKKVKQDTNSTNHIINLQSIAIGNGITDPHTQYQYYSKMACNSTYPPVLKESDCKAMDEALPYCLSLTEQCYNNTNPLTCSSAYWYCSEKIVEPYSKTGLSIYDVRVKDDPAQHDGLIHFVNRPDVREQLGISSDYGHWVPCSDAVHWEFNMAGDKMRNFAHRIPPLLHDGIRVLIYAGDADYICNWYGVKAWTTLLDWKHKDEFNAAGDQPWVPRTSHQKQSGEIRSYGPFVFLRIFGSSHMVPTDLPEESFDMFINWIFGSLPSSS